MTTPRALLRAAGRAALTLALAGLVPGCGPPAPEFDASSRYTPDSLAQELLFRYRALSPRAKARRAATAKTKPVKSEPGKTQEDATAKKALAQNVDDLAEEAVGKMLLIRDVPQPEVLKKVEEAIARDAQATPNDKKLLLDALEAAAGGK